MDRIFILLRIKKLMTIKGIALPKIEFRVLTMHKKK